MSRKVRETSEAANLGQKRSRRDLLKRTLLVLGAAALVQPRGGVVVFASQDVPKKDKNIQPPTVTSPPTKGKKGGKKKGKHKTRRGWDK